MGCRASSRVRIPPFPPANKQRRPSRGVFHSYIPLNIPIKQRLTIRLRVDFVGISSNGERFQSNRLWLGVNGCERVGYPYQNLAKAHPTVLPTPTFPFGPPWQTDILICSNDCDYCCRGFEPHQPPQSLCDLATFLVSRAFFFHVITD